MRKILVTGANGLVGKHLCARLPTKDTNTLSRGNNAYGYLNYFQCEISPNQVYHDALSECEVVIHCAARVHLMNEGKSAAINLYRDTNVDGTINLAKQAISAGVKRFIFISSIKVLGESTRTGKPFFNLSNISPCDAYGLSKAEAEIELLELVKNTGLEVVIIRPTLVYGPGVKANFASLINLVSKGIPLPFGCLTQNKRSLVSVDNLVDLIVTCIDHPKAANQVFLVSDDQDVSTSEMVREMAIALNKPAWQLPVPVWCYKLVGKLFNKSAVVDRLTGSLQVDISHTKDTLGWRPPQSLRDGFKQTAEAFLHSKKNSGKA
ncbi:SDR family oxidoreductase [Vibrio cholerae]|uniref:UDP-glucose 4-epimerase family protein n=1 Tax=Vibrio TaxID=662 RepID=UPI000DE1DF72|nr:MULTISPECIES: SDR family oxidoreductase [Vibrio]EGR4317612.1 SDR family oxidoreductase [Vibrio cholerae]ELF3151339.1 SDR family oxidoreductase [Vibrio cholerae]ELH5114990.1 SDR family oxidoreductase [Vibrio cholerae]MEB5597676.1 NAD-dependent epimerase/dehydratase family protein [Vibrio cholerae]RBM39189.1 UDP-glucose 4-epimerase [Vibrio paracholerae]